jgi:ribonucleoside-triphosphate reductase
VYFPITAFEKLNIEAPYHTLTNAGHISYVEVDGDVAKNPKAFEAIIRHMHDVGIGYGSINHPIDRDPICGYNGIINDKCLNVDAWRGDVKFDEFVASLVSWGTLESFSTMLKKRNCSSCEASSPVYENTNR